MLVKFTPTAGRLGCYTLQTGQNVIRGIKVVEQIKYLGVIIDNKRNIYAKHIEERLVKAKRLERMTFGIIEKSCNRLLIGKVYWKNICLPAILYGLDIMKLNTKDIDKLQVIENNVYRKILRAASYTPTGTLRGEIGSSLMKTRLYKGKLLYYRGIFNRNNELLKEIVKNENCKLSKEINMILQEIGIPTNEFLKYSINDIKRKCQEWDTNIWKIENGRKTSLEIYNRFKIEIKQEKYYNEEKSLIIFKMKTNTLNLNERKRHRNESTECNLCNNENENLNHFLLHCPALEETRSKLDELQRPREEDENNIIGKLLFSDNPDEENIYELWLARKRKMNEASVGCD